VIFKTTRNGDFDRNSRSVQQLTPIVFRRRNAIKLLSTIQGKFAHQCSEFLNWNGFPKGSPYTVSLLLQFDLNRLKRIPEVHWIMLKRVHLND
jgi:hypothetical protein